MRTPLRSRELRAKNLTQQRQEVGLLTHVQQDDSPLVEPVDRCREVVEVRTLPPARNDAGLQSLAIGREARRVVERSERRVILKHNHTIAIDAQIVLRAG